MAASIIPHFANDEGAETIAIGVKEFQCMGARRPFDHPHVYLDMGSDDQIICPYCSTLYIYRANLKPTESEPAGCLVTAEEDAAA
ncbi:MAG: zinc-finger domain-containing protein [Pseudomonadota bacterium]